MKILGIDPGSRVAGFSVIESPDPSLGLNWKNIHLINAGTVKLCDTMSAKEKLIQIGSSFKDLIDKEQPDCCILESAFFGVNARSALKLGEVRGAIISSLGFSDICVFEVSPNFVKKNITGNGHATKEQVKLSIESLLKISLNNAPYDVSDAIAIGLSFCLSLRKVPPKKSPISAWQLDKGITPIG